MDKDISALITRTNGQILHNLANSYQEIDKHIGNTLKKRRVALGYSQKALAKRIDISPQKLQEYESGSGKITASRLVVLASSLGVKASYFLDEIESISCSQTAELKELYSACENIANVKLRDAIMDIIDIAKIPPVKT